MMSEVQDLTLATLADLDDGRIAIVWSRALSRVVEDLRDRPGLKASRKVTLELVLSPISDDRSELYEVEVDATVRENVPRAQSRSYSMKPHRGGLYFRPFSEDDVHQRSLDLRRVVGDEKKQDSSGLVAAEGES